MKASSILVLFLFGFALYSCNVSDIDKYNSEFVGNWHSDIYYLGGDSVRNYFTVDGKESGFGLACKKDEAFYDCMYFKAGRIKYNKASKAIQIGGDLDVLHYVDREPFINASGKWEIIIDSTSYFKY